MTNKQILKKAIEKAVKGGWCYSDLVKCSANYEAMAERHCGNPARIIFDHDFAKAFWGEEWVSKHGNKIDQFTPEPIRRDWQFHLQQMVLEKEPLKYLNRFLEKEV